MKDHTQIRKLLEPLFFLFNKRLVPTSEALLLKFQQQALKLNIPATVVEQLADFYKVTNGIPCLDGFTFHGCDDKNLFEWWNDKKELWLGCRDNDVLRWKDKQFCLGDASTVSYSEKYVFSSLKELLEKSFEKWYLGLWDRFMNSHNEIDLWSDRTRYCK